MKASRQFQIIHYAQNGLDVNEINLNEEEMKFYESIQKELKKWRAKGIEPMFDLPYDYDDTEEGDDEMTLDIYRKDFDERRRKRLKEEQQ